MSDMNSSIYILRTVNRKHLVLLMIAGRPAWWIILYFIPLVNFIVAIIVNIDIAKNFGKDAAFGLGLAFLGFIFYPILGFGSATYNKVN